MFMLQESPHADAAPDTSIPSFVPGTTARIAKALGAVVERSGGSGAGEGAARLKAADAAGRAWTWYDERPREWRVKAEGAIARGIQKRYPKGNREELGRAYDSLRLALFGQAFFENAIRKAATRHFRSGPAGCKKQ